MTNRWCAAAVLSALLVPAASRAAGRVVVVGAHAQPVAEALRLELDAFGVEVVAASDETSQPALPLDAVARLDRLERLRVREGATDVAEIVVAGDGVASVSCVRAAGHTHRRVRVSSPLTESDYRALALVVRSMVHAVSIDVSSPEPEPEPRRRPMTPDRVAPARATAAATPSDGLGDARLSAAIGWTTWTRTDGDFFFHGPGAGARLRTLRWLVVEGRVLASFPSTATTDPAQVESTVLGAGLTALTPVLSSDGARLLAGVGIDIDAVSSTGTRRGRRFDRSIVAAVPSATASAELAPSGPMVVQATLRAGYALNRTAWLVRGTEVITDGRVALEAGLAMGLFWR